MARYRCESFFVLGTRGEAAGICSGCRESMDFQSQPADTERVVTFLDKAVEAILSDPWPQYMAQLSIRGACGFVLVGKADITPYWLGPRRGGITRAICLY